MPKISTIVPVYNTQEYLRLCLNSIVSQTFDDIEIICIDDASTDSSHQILKDYAAKDRRIKIIFQEKLGVESARANGMEFAKGEFIHFCDSDDYLELGMYEKMLSSIEQSNADIAMCNSACFDENEICVADRIKKYSLNSPHGLIQIDLAAQKHNPVLWNKLFRCSIILKNKIEFPYKTQIQRGFDEIFTHIYFLSSKTCFCIPDFLYNHRIRNNSTINSAGKNEMFFDNWLNLAYLYNHIEKNNMDKDTFSKIFLSRYYNLTSNFFAKLLDRNKKLQAIMISRDFFLKVNLIYGNPENLLHDYIAHLLMRTLMFNFRRDKDLVFRDISDVNYLLTELENLNVFHSDDGIFKSIKNKKYDKAYKLMKHYDCKMGLKWAERIFSIKKSIDRKYKAVTIFGQQLIIREY